MKNKIIFLQGAANVCVGDECVQAGFCSENLCNTIDNFKEMANSDFSKTPWSFSRGSSKRFLNLIIWTLFPKSHIGPQFVPNHYEEFYENVLFLCIFFIFSKQYFTSWFITNKRFSKLSQIYIGMYFFSLVSFTKVLHTDMF